MCFMLPRAFIFALFVIWITLKICSNMYPENRVAKITNILYKTLNCSFNFLTLTRHMTVFIFFIIKKFCLHKLCIASNYFSILTLQKRKKMSNQVTLCLLDTSIIVLHIHNEIHTSKFVAFVFVNLIMF